MSSFIYRSWIVVVVLTVFVAGCGNKIRVRGQVLFSDDQTPLAVGTVILQSDTHLAKGAIQPDGSFEVGSVKANDGLPPGVYRVSISGAVKSPESQAMDSSGNAMDSTSTMSAPDVPQPLIDVKYTNPETSGIVFDTSKDKELLILVDR